MYIKANSSAVKHPNSILPFVHPLQITLYKKVLVYSFYYVLLYV